MLVWFLGSKWQKQMRVKLDGRDSQEDINKKGTRTECRKSFDGLAIMRV